MGLRYSEEARLPNWIPLIGGPYRFGVSGQRCIAGDQCNPTLSWKGSIQASFTDYVSGKGTSQAAESWATDRKKCVRVLKNATWTLSAEGKEKLPVWILAAAPLGTIEVGGVLVGRLEGQLQWAGANYPAWPNGGEVELRAGTGPYGQMKILGGWVGGEITGIGSVTALYTAPKRFEFPGVCLELRSDSHILVLNHYWSKKWGTCAPSPIGQPLVDALALPSSQAMVRHTAALVDDVPVEEVLVLTIDPVRGTSTIYEGLPVLATVSSDLTDDGRPAVAHSTNGESLVAWTKAADDPAHAMGNAVVVATQTAASWTAPVVVQDATHFSRGTAAAFDSGGTPMILWASAPATLTLTSPVTDVLHTIENSDIFFARRSCDHWTTPAELAALPGGDEGARVAAGPGGLMLAAWVNTRGGTSALLTAFWDGASWSAPRALPTHGPVESVAVAYSGTTPLLVWAEDADADPATGNDLVLHYSSWGGNVWTEPRPIAAPPASSSTSAAVPDAPGWAPARLEEKGPFLVEGIGNANPCCDQQDDAPPKLPDPPNDSPLDSGASEGITPEDPNEKTAPPGTGPLRIVRVEDELRYIIYFENVITATAPAQEVIVTDNLDPNLDWSTLSFTEVAFGDQIVAAEGDQFTTRQVIPNYRTEVSKSWWVDVTAQLNRQTGRVTWSFRTLDPATEGLPEDPLAGFLPPNDASGRGEGHVSFAIRPEASVPLGTTIRNRASIVFDTNDPISTNEVWKTIGIPETTSRNTYLPLIWK